MKTAILAILLITALVLMPAVEAATALFTYSMQLDDIVKVKVGQATYEIHYASYNELFANGNFIERNVTLELTERTNAGVNHFLWFGAGDRDTYTFNANAKKPKRPGPTITIIHVAPLNCPNQGFICNKNLDLRIS